MIDAALQRKNMVESQVRPSDVTDRRITRAMLAIPREQFVPAQLKSLAYIDNELTLSSGREAPRALMAPRTFAKLVQLADLAETDIVLFGIALGRADVAAPANRTRTTPHPVEANVTFVGA